MAKLKALVIDDSRIMRQMVMESLRKAKHAEFEFTEAEDGQVALAKLAETDVHIAFVDWNMPNMSGIKFVRAVRAIEKRDDKEPIPMVMVTSEKTLSKVEEALDEAGADSFISKPFTVETLELKLKKVIEKATLVQVRRLRRQREMAAPVAAASEKKGFFGNLFS
jgi:two-component system chemotaxis response regulator CheY